MWFNKNVVTLNVMGNSLASLAIMSSRFIYIFNKFGLKIGDFNTNLSFPIM